MKWVTLICVLLCTIATESRHLQKRDADHHSRHVSAIFTTLGKENFNHILLAMMAQNLQKCSVEEHMKVVEELSTFAEHCVDHEDEADCQKPLTTIFYEKICKAPNLETSYPWSTDCCAKTEPEREKCFHDHRITDMEPFKKPDADAACKQQTEHPHEAFHFYIDTVAKRHPTLQPPAVLGLAKQYSIIMHECCAAEEKEKCFDAKFVDVYKATLYLEFHQKHSCHILKTFPDRVYQAKKIAKMSQKFPGAPFDIISKLVHESVHLSKDCCKEDVVECMIEKMEYIQHVCDNQEKISPSLKACCEKSLLERTPCMIALPKDDIPADVTKEMKEFVEAEDVCKHFADEKDIYLGKFLYEFSRRHPEFPHISCLRVAKGYEALLTKCCAEEHPADCYKKAGQLFDTRIKESLALAKQNCEAYDHLGPYFYQTVMLGRYVPKMPQVSDETLLTITGKMTTFAAKCCGLPEKERFSCAEEKLDLLLGDMCERESHTFINDQVHHCCIDSYSDRRPCFTKLSADPSYKKPAFDANLFKVGADICEGAEEEQKNKRLTLLIHVLKEKHDISAEKLKQIIGEFTKAREECCAAEDHQACFDAKAADHLKNERNAHSLGKIIFCTARKITVLSGASFTDENNGDLFQCALFTKVQAIKRPMIGKA